MTYSCAWEAGKGRVSLLVSRILLATLARRIREMSAYHLEIPRILMGLRTIPSCLTEAGRCHQVAPTAEARTWTGLGVAGRAAKPPVSYLFIYFTHLATWQ